MPSSSLTARNRFGIAAEASTVPAVIRSRRLLNVRNRPDSTSTAPMSSTGCFPALSTWIRPKSTWRPSIWQNWSAPMTEAGE
jgi:hypothetical protein